MPENWVESRGKQIFPTSAPLKLSYLLIVLICLREVRTEKVNSGYSKFGKYMITEIRLPKARAVSWPEFPRIELKRRLLFSYLGTEDLREVLFSTFILVLKNITRSLKYPWWGADTQCFKFWRNSSHMESWGFIYVKMIQICWSPKDGSTEVKLSYQFPINLRIHLHLCWYKLT